MVAAMTLEAPRGFVASYFGVAWYAALHAQVSLDCAFVLLYFKGVVVVE